MENELMERPGIFGTALHAVRGELRRRGTARLLHISKILIVKEALELSDEQVQELRDLRLDLARKLIKLTGDIRIARLDSINTIASKPVNFEQLRGNAKNVSQLRLQRKLAVIDSFEKASKTLSSDQKEKLSEYLSAWVDENEEEAQESEE